MKSLFKIVSRYIGAAFFITFLILILNIFLDAYFILYYGEASQNLPGIENVSKVQKQEMNLKLQKKEKKCWKVMSGRFFWMKMERFYGAINYRKI